MIIALIYAWTTLNVGGDDVTEDGGDPTADELSSLAVKVSWIVVIVNDDHDNDDNVDDDDDDNNNYNNNHNDDEDEDDDLDDDDLDDEDDDDDDNNNHNNNNDDNDDDDEEEEGDAWMKVCGMMLWSKMIYLTLSLLLSHHQSLISIMSILGPSIRWRSTRHRSLHHWCSVCGFLPGGLSSLDCTYTPV